MMTTKLWFLRFTHLNDGAIFELEGMRFAFSTNSHTVDPIFFSAAILVIWPSMEPSMTLRCTAVIRCM